MTENILEKNEPMLKDFLPIYPDFKDEVEEILGDKYIESGNSNFDIYRKKEFYDYRLEEQEFKPKETGKQMKHQTIIARFLSSHTPYNGLLLMHEPGTGKTCSSVAAIEQIKSEMGSYNSYDGALILMKGTNLINNYINELVFICTCKEQDSDKKCVDGPYIPSDYHEDGITEEQKKRRINSKIKEFYEFDTFGVFSTKVSKMKEESIIKRYSNKIIVIDEVHNLRIKDEENHYSIIHNFLHIVKNSKIILLTGTPMVDRPEEIASVLNLILPINKQLPVEDDFVKEYLLKSDNKNISILDKSKRDELKNYFHGYISYLKAMRSDVKKSYIGDIRIGSFNLYPLVMSKFQTSVYHPAYLRDKDSSYKKGVYNDSIQSSLFVFPNKKYGTEGFMDYVQQTIQKSMLDDKERSIFKLSSELKDYITKDAPTVEKRLERLRKYSTIYADCIEKLLDPNDHSNHFVYIKLVKGSGAILFSKLLELFGFKESKGGFNKGLNYSIITNLTTSDKENLDILKTFNHRSNMNGKYIKVIIGSKIISEGITFKNVQNIHIFSPSWNFSETDQAIARGYRLFSHRDLEDAGIDVNVKIFLYCVLPDLGDYEENLENSIDYQMYSVSNDKDISIKSIEKVIKESSFDCALNKNRNSFPESRNNSRECNYGNCKYKCDGVSNDLIDNITDKQLDLSTYNLYYSESDLNIVIEKIKEVFDTYNIVSITFDKLLRIVIPDSDNHNKHNKYRMLIEAITKMVSNNITINSILGNKVFFRFDNDMLYLTTNLKNNTNFLDSYYIENFPLQNEILLNDKIDDLYYRSLPKLFKNLKSEVEVTKRRNILRRFPISVQEFLLEMSVLSEERGLSGINNIREFILEEFRPFIERFEEDNLIVSTLLYSEDSEDLKLRCLDISEVKEDGWKDCSEENIKKVMERLSQKKIEMHENPYGYYGILNKSNDKFSIANIVAEKEKVRITKTGKLDSRRASTGRVCTTWDHEELLTLINKIKLSYSDEFKKKYYKKTDEQINKEYDNKIYVKISKIMSKEIFESLSTDDKLRLMYWGTSGKDKINKPEICNAIEKWFKDHDLLEEKIIEQKNKKKK
jgi:superfamily II DNA or RNA helicase